MPALTEGSLTKRGPKANNRTEQLGIRPPEQLQGNRPHFLDPSIDAGLVFWELAPGLGDELRAQSGLHGEAARGDVS